MAELSILPNEDDKVVPVKVDHVDVVCSYCAKVILDNDSKLFKCPHLVAMQEERGNKIIFIIKKFQAIYDEVQGRNWIDSWQHRDLIWALATSMKDVTVRSFETDYYSTIVQYIFWNPEK